MTVAYTKLPGLDRQKLLGLVEPILRAHGVVGVELIWRSDRKGQVLELTVERADSQTPGAGVTIDLCTEISRDLSAALDVAEVIPSSGYHLEVGSPGLDRVLYGPDDYRRFAGQLVKVKLKSPLEQEGFSGQKVVRGILFGLGEAEDVIVETERGNVALPLNQIQKARLVFEWHSSKPNSGRGSRPTSGKKSRPKRSK